MNRVVALSGWALLLVVCMSIVGCVLYGEVMGQPVSSRLGQMSDTALGFMFGAMVGMVKELLQQKEEKRDGP